MIRKLRQNKTPIRIITSLIVILVMVAVVGSKNKEVQAATSASSTNPCVSAPKPAAWKHVVVIMFENHTYNQVIGNSSAPYITNLANKCATAKSWYDANKKVDGSSDGSYNSKPSYATLTSGVSPSVHGLKDDTYSTKSNVDNIYNQLRLAGKSGKDYFSWGGTGCSATGSGSYHDAIRYYNNIDSSYCDSHDVAMSQFMTDVNSGNLPEFSMILPTNCENMHSCSSVSDVVKNGDNWIANFLPPLLDSAQYKSGDTAVFYIWDEDSPIPNVLLAPSISPGSTVPTPSGNPISHFSALRTWEEMLGLPLIGDTSKAPSLLATFNGSGVCTVNCNPDNPPTVSITSPSANSTQNQGVLNITANATDDKSVTKVEFYVDNVLKNTDTSAPYSYSWDTSTVTGSHILTAKAYDGVNSATTSSPIGVTIIDPNACTSPTVASSGTISVNVPTTSTYKVWVRLQAKDATNNSLYVKVDGECPQVMGDSTSISSTGWTWVDYKDGTVSSKVNVNLTAGNHNITLMGKEDGVKVDKVLLLAGNCTPTSISAAECIDTTAPVVTITSPTANQEITGSTTISANASDGSGVSKVSFYLDNATSPFFEDTTSPYQATWDSKSVADGAHSIRVSATDAVGNVSAKVSVAITVNNADKTPPSDPSGLTVTKNTYNEVDLSWTASSDNTAVAGYNIYRNGNSAPYSTVTGTTYKDATVVANTSYIYQIEAFDTAGNKSGKIAIGVTTPSNTDNTPPSAPTNLSGTATEGNVALKWTASTDNVGVTNYLIRRGGNVIASVTGTSYNDSSVQPETTYSYEIIAQDAAVNSSLPSNTVTVKTPPIINPVDNPPSVPNGLVAHAISPSQVNLSWNPSTDDNGVTGYKIYRNGSSTPLATVTTTTFGDSTVAAGQTYTYKVSATDIKQESAKSSSVSVTTPPDNRDTSLSDNFSAGASKWSPVAGTWAISTDGNQGNVYNQTKDGDAWSTAGSSTWTDYVVEAKIKPTKFITTGSTSQFAGLYGRWQDQSHWYYVTLRNTGVIELKKNNGNSYSVLDSKNVGIATGKWYDVKLEMVGDSLKVYLDGNLTLSATDSTIKSGKIALGSYFTSTEFDDVSVTTNQEPQILQFDSTDDAYVLKRYPNKNYGTSTSFLIDTSPQRDGLIKFTVSGINGRTVTSTVLRLYSVGNSDKGGDFDPSSNNWNESTVTWNNAPAAGSGYRLASLGAVSKGTFVDIDVRNFIHADGTYSLRISSPSNDTMSYSTHEDVQKSNTVAPKLLMSVQ